MKIFSIVWVEKFLTNIGIMNGIADEMGVRGIGASISKFELSENLSQGDIVKVIDDSGPKIAKILQASETFGILQETGVIGEIKDVAILGEVSAVHTGAISGSIAYVQTNLTLGTVVTSYPAGRFISPSELVLNFNP